MGSFKIVSKIISLGRTAILARLLLPEQFGIYGIAALILAFLEIFTETGINVFLVQEKKEINDYINSAWTISIVRGIFIALIIFLSAPFISLFFGSSNADSIIRLVSLVAVIRGFINPSIVKFQKELQFNKEFILRFSVFTVDTLVAVSLAYITHSPASLVWGLIGGAILEVILSFLLVSPKPKLSFDFKRVKKIVGRGKWVTLGGIFGYISREGDDVVVGKLLGTGFLGLYQMAHRLATLPVSEITDAVSKVTFPVYVRISNEKERLKKAYLKTSIILFVLVLPFNLVMFAFPKEIITLVLGNNWLFAVPVLKVLSIFAIVWSLMGSVEPLFYSVNRQDIVAKVKMIKFLGLILTIVPLTLSYGLVGAAVSALFSISLVIPLYSYFLYKYFK